MWRVQKEKWQKCCYCFAAGAMPNEVSICMFIKWSQFIWECALSCALCFLTDSFAETLYHELCFKHIVVCLVSFFSFSQTDKQWSRDEKKKLPRSVGIKYTKCTNVLDCRCPCTMAPWFAESIYIHFWCSESAQCCHFWCMQMYCLNFQVN